MSKSPLNQLPHVMRPENVAERVRAVRDFHGLGPAEMADSLQYDRSSWSKIESGKRALPLDVCYKMNLRYGSSLEFIFTGKFVGLEADLRDFLWSRFSSSAS